MSTAQGNGGMPARRAVVRWAARLFRRDWRQHVLILSLLTVAVAAAVGFSCAAFNVAPVSGQAEFGDANHFFRFNDPTPATLQPKLDAAKQWFGQIDAIGHSPVPLPGTVKQIDYRSQDPDGPFGKPMLRLRSGRYPTADNEVAVTDGVVDALGVHIGSTIDLDGVSRTVVGTVENPSDLGDEFALLPPSALAQSKFVTMLVDASEARVGQFRPPGDTGRIISSRGDLPEDVVAAILTLVVSTLVLMLVALIAGLVVTSPALSTGSLSRSSSTIRSAVFFPIPGIRVSRAISLPRIAPTISSAAIPLRIVIASFGPMPLTVISFSNSCFSRERRKP